MFFDESGPERKSQKPRLRLAGTGSDEDLSARERLEAARLRRSQDEPSLLDRLDAVTRRTAQPVPEPEMSEPLPPQPASNQSERVDVRSEPEHQPGHQWHRDDYASPPAYLPMSDSNGPLIDPVYVFDAIRRFRYLIAATTLLGGVIGVGVALNTPKLYSSTAQIIIDPRNNKVIENDITPDVFLSEAALAIVDSQVSIIASPVVMDKVAGELGLDKDAEFNGSKTGPLSVLKSLVGLGNKADSSRMGIAIRNLNELAGVNRQAGTFIVNVTGKSEDPKKAALIANTIVEVYMRERAEGRASTAGKAADALGSRLPELKKQVLEAEKAVAEFKAQNDLFDTQGRQIDDDSVVNLNAQLNAARINTVNLNARASSAKALTADLIASGDLPEELSSNTLGTLRGRYTQALQRIQGLEAKLGPMHPDLQQAKGEVASLRDSVDQEIKRIRSSIQTELKRAVQTEQELAASLAQMKAKLSNTAGPLVTLRDLERTAASARQVYEQFLLRAQETTEQASIDSTNVTKTNTAKPADEAEGTSRKLIMLGGFIGGALFGLGLAILRGMLDAIATRFGPGSRRLQPHGAPYPPAPVNPVSPGSQSRTPVRGSFQPVGDSRPAPLGGLATTAENQNPPIQNGNQQAENPMYPYPPMIPSPYAQFQGWPQPMPPQMYGMPMQQPYVPVMAPVPMPHPAAWHPQYQPQMMPQQVMAPQFMPQPVVVQNYPAPAPAPQPVQAAEPAREKPQPRVIRSAGDGSDIDDIRSQLAEMREELLNLATLRRRA